MPDRDITADSWSRGCGPHPDREIVRRRILHAEDGAATTARLDEALDLIAASMAADRRIEHLLAGALGYRTHGEGGPGSPSEYATGEHTAETLAIEAANRLRERAAYADQDRWHPLGECRDRSACWCHAGRDDHDAEPLEAVVSNDVGYVLLGLYGFVPFSVRRRIAAEVHRMVGEHRARRGSVPATAMGVKGSTTPETMFNPVHPLLWCGVTHGGPCAPGLCPGGSETGGNRA